MIIFIIKDILLLQLKFLYITYFIMDTLISISYKLHVFAKTYFRLNHFHLISLNVNFVFQDILVESNRHAMFDIFSAYLVDQSFKCTRQMRTLDADTCENTPYLNVSSYLTSVRIVKVYKTSH